MARTYHQKIVYKAHEAIRRVLADDSVELGQILDSLDLLEELISDSIETIKIEIQERRR